MTKKTPTAKAPAAKEYALCQQDIQAEIERLQTKLVAHAKKQAREPSNWGFGGDLMQVRTMLRQLNSFLAE